MSFSSLALLALTLNIYEEGRGEPVSGQFAIADTTLNRVHSPRWPDNVLDVVLQRKQFSWVEAAGIQHRVDLVDYQATLLSSMNTIDLEAYKHAESVARVVLTEGYNTQFKYNHYHTIAVKPVWSRGFLEDFPSNASVIGYHIFYKM